MLTDCRLLILGLEARQNNISEECRDILKSLCESNRPLENSDYISELKKLSDEYMSIEYRLNQVDPKRNEIPF